MLMLRPLAAVQYIHHRETKSGVAGQLIQGQGSEYANIIVLMVSYTIGYMPMLPSFLLNSWLYSLQYKSGG
jgi:hypothetical protein